MESFLTYNFYLALAPWLVFAGLSIIAIVLMKFAKKRRNESSICLVRLDKGNLLWPWHRTPEFEQLEDDRSVPASSALRKGAMSSSARWVMVMPRLRRTWPTAFCSLMYHHGMNMQW